MRSRPSTSHTLAWSTPAVHGDRVSLSTWIEWRRCVLCSGSGDLSRVSYCSGMIIHTLRWPQCHRLRLYKLLQATCNSVGTVTTRGAMQSHGRCPPHCCRPHASSSLFCSWSKGSTAARPRPLRIDGDAALKTHINIHTHTHTHPYPHLLLAVQHNQ